MKSKLLKIKKFFVTCYFYLSDLKYALYYSLSFGQRSQRIQQARIMLLIHSIEKGLSFTNKRKGWGEAKAYAVAQRIDKYRKDYKRDSYVAIAINVIVRYLNDEFATKNTNIRNYIQTIIDKNKECISDIGGTKQIGEPQFSVSFDELNNFFETRHSVRFFSDVSITNEEIVKAKNIAASTPTACNRQSTKVYGYGDKDIMKKILDNQLGDQGWCLNADKLFVITSSMSFFNATYEREQPLIDGGLYAMNFVLGLHAQCIASCFKMYVRTPKIDKEFRKICGIPKDEIPIVLVLAGHYSHDTVKVPYSYRINQ